MATPLHAPQGQFIARPIRSAQMPPEGPQTMALLIPFASQGAGAYEADFTLSYQQNRFTTIQSVYVDCSLLSAVMYIDVPATGQRLTIPAGAMGYVPVLAPDTPKIIFTSTATDADIQVQVLNVPVPTPGLWTATGGSAIIPNPLPVTGDWLTDAELRASPVDVLGPLTNAELRAANIGVTTTPASATAIIGRGGNIATRIVSTPAVTAGAYSAGQVIGGKLTLANAVRSSVLTGLIQSVSLTTLTTQTAPIDVIFFSDDPSASTITNGVALAVDSADVGKVAAIANLFSPSQLGTPSLYFSGGLAVPVIAASTTLYACIVARASLTLGSTTNLTLISRIIQD